MKPVSASTGQRAPLSRERVLRAAVEVADAGGIGSLTIRSLAQALGVSMPSASRLTPCLLSQRRSSAEAMAEAARYPTVNVRFSASVTSQSAMKPSTAPKTSR